MSTTLPARDDVRRLLRRRGASNVCTNCELGRWSISGEVIGPRPVLPAMPSLYTCSDTYTRTLIPNRDHKTPAKYLQPTLTRLRIVFSYIYFDEERERERENQVDALCSEIEYWLMFIGYVRVEAYKGDEIVSNRSSFQVQASIRLHRDYLVL